MSPERLNSDQRLLYDALREIWEKNSIQIVTTWDKDTERIIASCCIIASLLIGITAGVLYGSRHALEHTAIIVGELEKRIIQDRELIIKITKEQERGLQERAALARTLNIMRRDIEEKDNVKINKRNNEKKNKK